MSDLTQTLDDALGNPNVQNYLHMIASAEGTAQADDPYSQGFGNTTIGDLSSHPGTKHTFTQTDGKQNVTTAAGAYQFIKPTWDGIQKALNLPDFSPKSQDMGALYLMNQNGSLQDVMNGDYKSAVQKDGKTWASLPSSPYAQNKRSQQFVDQALGQSSGGGLISDANASDAPGATSSDLSTVPAPKLLDAFQRAQEAQDSDAMQQLSGALTPRLQQGLQAAQSQNDTDAVTQIQGMLDNLGAKPQAPAQQPNAQQAAPGVMGPPSSAKKPSTWQSLGNLASQVINHPIDTASAVGTALKNGAVDYGHRLADAPLKTVDDTVRGVADTLTFGAADKAAAYANSKINGTAYDDELLKQRQQDQAGGSAFTAGQLAGALVPVAGPVGAARLVPTTSKVARIAAGAGAGAVEGTANYLGHNDGPTDSSDLSANAVLGAVGGSIPGLTTGPTDSQLASTFIRKAGSTANAQRDAEIITGLDNLASRSTQGGTALGPADANALASGYTQKAADALRQMDKTPERQTLLNALDRARGMSDDDINALRQLPNGNAVADSIQMRQRALSMTAPTPANTNPILGAARTAVDNGLLGAVPVVGPILNLKSARTAVINALGGRENRTGNIASALEQAQAARAALQRLGPSQASQSAQSLAQAGQGAIAGRAAAAQAAQAAQASRQAQAFIQRGQAAAASQRQAVSQAQAQGAQMFQQGQQTAMQARVQGAAQQAQAAAQARQTMAGAIQSGQAQRAAAAQAAAPVQQGLIEAQKAQQATQAAAAKAVLQQRQALADTQSSDPSYLLGMSNQFGAPRSQAEMAEFSKVMRQNMPSAQAAQQEAQAQAAQVVAARQAASQAQAQARQDAVDRITQGDFSRATFEKPALARMMEFNNAPNTEAIKPTLQNLAKSHPDAASAVAQLLTPGTKDLTKQQYYLINDALKGAHGAKEAAPVVSRDIQAPQPALADATSNVQNPLAYKAGIANRQRVQKAALEAAQDPEVKRLITKMSTERSQSSRSELFNEFMQSHTVDKQVEAKRLAEPLITYGK